MANYLQTFAQRLPSNFFRKLNRALYLLTHYSGWKVDLISESNITNYIGSNLLFLFCKPFVWHNISMRTEQHWTSLLYICKSFAITMVILFSVINFPRSIFDCFKHIQVSSDVICLVAWNYINDAHEPIHARIHRMSGAHIIVITW